MNPDDPNNPQAGGGSTPPADDQGGAGTPTPATDPVSEGRSEPAPAGGEIPASETPAAETLADAPAASCHCGKPSSGGTCTGCNLPEASCSCQPTA